MNVIIERGMKNVFSKIKKGTAFQEALYLMTTVTEGLKGGYNTMRQTVIKHCMNLTSKEIFKEQELKELEYLGWKLDIIANWEWNVERSTRCRFIYWLRSLFPIIFEMIRADKHRLNQLPYFLVALRDPLLMLQNIKHLATQQIAVDNYKKEIYESFTKRLTVPICKGIEDDLRVQIHCVLIQDIKQKNPMKDKFVDFRLYTSMSELHLFEKKIDMSEEVRLYLSKVFYEMTALSPHDASTYEHMRLLAKEKYQI
jgi:WASH complex subunit 7